MALSDPIRIYVGTSDYDDWESCMVLEHTLRKHSDRLISITWMRKATMPGWHTARWATPFTAYRWATPAMAQYTSRAIYMDSDMIVMDDIGKLYDQDIPNGAIALGRSASRVCVSLWDCAKAREVMPSLAAIKANPDAHRYVGGVVRPHLAAFEGRWNVFDDEPLDGAQCLHYTAMASQPHIRMAERRMGRQHWISQQRPTKRHPHWQELFEDLFMEAVEAGYRVEDYAPPPEENEK